MRTGLLYGAPVTTYWETPVYVPKSQEQLDIEAAEAEQKRAVLDLLAAARVPR